MAREPHNAVTIADYVALAAEVVTLRQELTHLTITLRDAARMTERAQIGQTGSDESRGSALMTAFLVFGVTSGALAAALALTMGAGLLLALVAYALVGSIGLLAFAVSGLLGKDA